MAECGDDIPVLRQRRVRRAALGTPRVRCGGVHERSAHGCSGDARLLGVVFREHAAVDGHRRAAGRVGALHIGSTRTFPIAQAESGISMSTRTCVVTLFALAALASVFAAQSRLLVLDNVRLVDGTGAGAVERARIVIDGDQIDRIGPAASTALPEGAQTIDLSGFTIIPGLIDLHFHIEDDPKMALRQLSHGITAFRDPGQWNEKFVELRRLIAADQLPGPRSFTPGPNIDGDRPAYPADSVVARDAEEARRLAERNVAQGASALKIYFRLPFASAQSVIGVCNTRGVPCTAHLEVLDARELIAAGLHGIEHITSFGISLVPRVKAEAYRQAVLRNNDARRDGRYRLFADADLDGPEAAALYAVLRQRRPWVDATLAVFERREGKPAEKTTAEMSAIMVAGFAKMK